MEAIILAGGLGTRLRNVIVDVPKVMAPILGRPFLEFLLESLIEKDFKRAIISVGYMAEKISSHFGRDFNGLQIDYVNEWELLGTGGAIKYALEHVSGKEAFVMNGDTFLQFDAVKVSKLKSLNQRGIIVAKKVQDTKRFGRLLVRDNLLVGFVPKGSSGPGLINAGCYLLNKEQFKNTRLGKKFSFESDYLLPSIHQKLFDVVETSGHFIDIGTQSDYLTAGDFFLDRSIP